MLKMNYKKEYQKCAETCHNTDYGNRNSVRKHNEAVDQMYKIVENASNSDSDAISDLISLLEDEMTSKWIAHHLVEKGKIDRDTRKKCIKIIKRLAKGDSAYAFGEKTWLKEWNAK